MGFLRATPLNSECINTKNRNPSVYISVTEGFFNFGGFSKLNNTLPEYSKKQSVKPNRLYYLDFLRILSAFAVVMIHCSAVLKHYSFYGNTFSNSFENTELFIYNFFNCISRFAVQIFVMISGTLFLDNSKNFTIEKILKKYAKRILISYFIFLVIYYIFSFFIFEIYDIDLFIYQVAYHLWFLPMIFSLYILTPILRKIINDEKLIKYIIIVGIIFFIILPSVVYLPKIRDFKVIIMSFCNDSKITYVLYFVLGYYINKKSYSQKFNIVIYILGLSSFLFLPILSMLGMNHGYGPEEFSSNNFFILNFLEAISVFLFIKNLFNKYTFNEKILNFISWLSKYTFGIYLVHVLLIKFVHKYNILDNVHIHITILPLIYCIAIFILSFVISFIISKIPFINKYIF